MMIHQCMQIVAVAKNYHVNSLPSLLFSLITQDSGLTRFQRLARQPVLSHGFESYNTYMLNISR